VWQNNVHYDGDEDQEGQANPDGQQAKPELPWNVVLHNDWATSMPRMVSILKKIIYGMTLKKATKIMARYTPRARPW